MIRNYDLTNDEIETINRSMTNCLINIEDWEFNSLTGGEKSDIYNLQLKIKKIKEEKKINIQFNDDEIRYILSCLAETMLNSSWHANNYLAIMGSYGDNVIPLMGKVRKLIDNYNIEL